MTTAEGDIDDLETLTASHTTDIAIANARQGGIWHQDTNTVVYKSSGFTVRQSYGAWGYEPSTNDFVFIAPEGGPGDRHWNYEGSTGSIIFTGVS
jgi:hypothetical protein